MRGNPEAEAFCRAIYPKLLGSLTLYLGDRTAAEDLSQEALARAWVDWRRVSRCENPEAWVVASALNLARSHRRRIAAERRAHARLRESVGIASSQIDVCERIVLSQELLALPARQRAVVILHYYLGFSFDQASVILDIPSTTARSLAYRARERLRQRLTPTEREAKNATPA